jgi:hypothetical protein
MTVAAVAARRTPYKRCRSATARWCGLLLGDGFEGSDLPNHLVPRSNDVPGMQLVFNPAERFTGTDIVIIDDASGEYFFAPSLNWHDGAAGGSQGLFRWSPATAAKLLARDEGRRIADNIAELPERLRDQ